MDFSFAVGQEGQSRLGEESGGALLTVGGVEGVGGTFETFSEFQEWWSSPQEDVWGQVGEEEAVEKPDEWDVLPDAVPFLQEILEEDDQTVEAACRDFIQQLPMMLE